MLSAADWWQCPNRRRTRITLSLETFETPVSPGEGWRLNSFDRLEYAGHANQKGARDGRLAGWPGQRGIPPVGFAQLSRTPRNGVSIPGLQVRKYLARRLVAAFLQKRVLVLPAWQLSVNFTKI